MWDDDRDDDLGHDQAGGDGGEHCVATSRYVPSSSPHARQRLQEQVYYLHCRDRQDAEDETRLLFTATDTGTSRADARALLWANRSVKSVCFHRLILSPSTGLGITTTEEAQAWTRTVMEELGRRLDRELTWVGSVHRNTGRPHVHVLVAGEAAQPSTGGAGRVVRFGRDDIKALRTRLTIDAARPIREAAQARERALARVEQEARRVALYERLGVRLTPSATPAQAVPLAPPSQAARKRHWWQRGP